MELEAVRLERDELQKKLHVPDYEAVRDRILRTWRLAKAPEKKERIKEALDRFIEALQNVAGVSKKGGRLTQDLRDSVPPSTPASTLEQNHTPESQTWEDKAQTFLDEVSWHE